MLCRHCDLGRVCRPRGLCWTCYYLPGVRELYPSTSMYARRGVGNVTGERPLPGGPTAHPPGSPGKVAVLEGRALLGQALWHPADHDPDPRDGGLSCTVRSPDPAPVPVPVRRAVRAADPEDEETMADLDALEAAQRACLPAWWPADGAADPAE